MYVTDYSRNVRNGAVLVRCAQPEVGWFGSRCTEDENIMRFIAEACATDCGVKIPLTNGADIEHNHTGSDYSSAASTPTSSTLTNGDIGSSSSTEQNGVSITSTQSVHYKNNDVMANGSATMVPNGGVGVVKTIDRSSSSSSSASADAGGGTRTQNGGSGAAADVSKQDWNLLIVDARSYTAAVGNRARGGGCEYIGKSNQSRVAVHTHVSTCM